MFRIIAGSARADGLKWGATRALLLASTVLATGIFAGAMVNPQTAQAACVNTLTISPPLGGMSTFSRESNTQKYLFSNGPFTFTTGGGISDTPTVRGCHKRTADIATLSGHQAN